tara:strand:+ start:214 stop:429 length:216 start_codon:yes stop_codon:yes gene_type:complete
MINQPKLKGVKESSNKERVVLPTLTTVSHGKLMMLVAALNCERLIAPVGSKLRNTLEQIMRAGGVLIDDDK